MDPNVSEWLNLVFRWIHVLAGVMWIGHLWFFNFVNAQVAKTYDPDSRKKVVPELMPRALYWFRWGAAYTWVTGILLLLVVYWAGNAMGSERMSSYGSGGIALLIVLVAFAVYDVFWKSMKNETTGMIVSLVLVALRVFSFPLLRGGRAVFICAGALFGPVMAATVWMGIWPNQRKIIAGVKGTGPAADPSIPAIASLRSKHNTYMSFPLIFFMVSNHFPTVYGADAAWVVAVVFVILGWGITKFLFNKAATPAPAQF